MMKVLITIKRSPAQRYLVHLLAKTVIKEVVDLIANERHSEAMVAAFTKGRFERAISEAELSTVKADLIITEHNASWDLTTK